VNLRKIKQIYVNMSLSNKITYMVLIMVMIPVFTISIIYFKQMQVSIRQEVSSNYVDFVKQYKTNLNYKLTVYQNLIETFSNNHNILNVLKEQYNYSSTDTVYISNVFTEEIEKAVFTEYSEIYNITFYAENREFPSNGRGASNYNVLESEYWYKRLLQVLDAGQSVMRYQTPGYNYEILSFVQYVRDSSQLELAEPLALLKVDVMANTLFSKDLINNMDANNQFIILDQHNNVIFSSNEQLEKRKFKEEFINQPGVNYLETKEILVSEHIEQLNWRIIFLFPYYEIEQKMNSLLKQAVPYVITICLFVVMMSYVMSYVLMKRLKRFIRKMSKVKEGQLEITDYIEGRDEIAIIDGQFNMMVSRLQEVIQENYIQGLQKKKAELTALQNQINPHFLFNTLESINSMAAIIEAKEICAISQSLGEILRYSITISDELVKLSEEINYVENYVNIQNIRFDNRFKLETEVPETLKGSKLMKLILQPIIENAILHAYRGKRDIGIMTIKAEANKSSLIITISDNGNGIAQEQLEQLNARIIAKEQEGKSIGLKNVHSRIQLAFGQQYGLKVESTVGAGTKVLISLPLLK